VAVRELKRFVAEYVGAEGCTVRRAPAQDRARVAVVGGGPAGMTAALELAQRGYRPTVFEKFPVAGGVPATAIPLYRLPPEVVQIDIDWICAHGVDLKTGVEIGKDRTLEDLAAEGFEAVIVAVGLARSRALPIPGADHPRVHRVMEFLTALRFGERPDIGEDVLIIGGGNVAMDAARSAVRLGAGRVRAMMLENEEEMPAWEWEAREAREEGVEFIHRRGPVEIVVEDGRIVRCRARRVTRVFDEQNRFAPEYDDGDVIEVPCDTVVFAIGQAPDTGFAEGSSLAVDERKRLAFDPATHRTNVPNVFACGEIVTPPGSVVEACAHGRRAAKAVDLYLSGRPIEIDDRTPPVIEKILPETAEKVLKVPREAVPTDTPEDRRGRFTEFEHTLPVPAVLREARRCMGCGSGAEVLVDKCAACLTCLRVCPFDIPKVTDVARIESRLCQACGICIAECPANAIVPKGYPVGDLVRRSIEALAALDGAAPRKILAYIGGHCASEAEWRGETSDRVPGVAEIYLHSTSRLSVPELLHAFEAGADAVVVVSCAEGKDRYPGVAARTRRRVEQAQEMLQEIGMDAGRLQLFEVGDRGREAIREALAQAAAQAAGG